MEIEYLQLMENTPKISWKINEPMTIEEIQDLEQKFNDNNPLPKALREFLFLAGHYNNTHFDTWPDIETMQSKALQEMQDIGELIERPIFVFSQHNSFESFLFVYLDEDQNDPEVYVYSADFSLDDEDIYHKNGYTFSGLVNMSVDRSIKGLSI